MRNSRRFRQRCVAAFALTLAATAANSQTPFATPDVAIGSAGTIAAIARQSDGSLILGGLFTRVDGAPRSNLARLHPDGSLDMQWAPAIDGFVSAIAVDANDDVIIGGLFGRASDSPRHALAKLDGRNSGAFDPDWNPGQTLLASHGVTTLTVGPTGDVFAAGEFRYQNIDHKLIRIDRDGRIDSRWNPGIDRDVSALATGGDGALYVSLNGVGVDCCLRKVATTGTGEMIADWHTAFEGGPGVMAVAADGSLYVGAWLPLDFGNGEYHHIVRFAPNSRGEIDPDWLPEYPQWVNALAVDGDAIYVSLDADSAHAAGIVKLATVAGAAEQWRTTGRGINALAIGTDHSLYAGGSFEGTGGIPPGQQPKLSLARLRAGDATALTTVDATVPGSVTAIARQSNGGTIVGGQFSRAGMTPRRNLLRLRPDGSLDPDWTASFDYFTVLAIAVDEHDDVYVGGDDLASLDPMPILKFSGAGRGAIDPRWSVSTDGAIAALATDQHGSLYVGGHYSSIAGVARQNVAKLATGNAAPDTAWTPSTADPVQTILIDGANGAIYLGSGSIGHGIPGSGVGTVYQGEIAKVSDRAGSPAKGWPLPLSGVPYALASTPDGSLYAAGTFVIDEDAPPADALKLSPHGFIDMAWARAIDNPDRRAASAIVVDARGDVYVGGNRNLANDSAHDVAAYLMKRAGHDGAASSDWSPAIAGDAVYALQLGPADTLYVGGDFSTIGDAARGSLMALPTTSHSAHSTHAGPDIQPPRPIASPGRLRPQGTSDAAATSVSMTPRSR